VRANIGCFSFLAVFSFWIMPLESLSHQRRSVREPIFFFQRLNMVSTVGLGTALFFQGGLSVLTSEAAKVFRFDKFPIPAR